MKQFWTVFRFEFMNYLRNKVFVGITIALVVLVAGLLFFPRIMSLFETEGETAEQTPGAEPTPIALYAPAGGSEELAGYLGAALPQYAFTVVEGDASAYEQMVRDGAWQAAVLIDGPLSFRYFTDSMGMYDATPYTIQEALGAKYRLDSLTTLGVAPEEASVLLNAQAELSVVETGKSQMDSFFYTYILIFALYMAILLYGQFVATSVATEKSSRAMELLITSARPTQLMFGKVIGSGLAGLAQFVVIFGSAFLFYNLNAAYWTGVPVVGSIFDMPADILLYAILFFVLGYFIYAFLFGALGSLVSRLEEINTSVLPITFLFIIAFVVVMVSMGSGDVDNTAMVVCSFIPFTSPMAMFTRIAMGNVSGLAVSISVVILLLSTVGVGYLSALIYRMGVLMYGKTPKLSEVFRMLKHR